jgi:predicted ABC-type ATPase
MPTMYVVAGPSGSGKTSAFPGDAFGCDYFNADDYAAMLNGGSYIGIPRSIRAEVIPICEKFIQDHIDLRKDFATETTLRGSVPFKQMELAHACEFVVMLIYVCVDNIGTSVNRITQRAYQGGHSGSEDTIRDIRKKSLANFLCTLDELGKTIDSLDVYDNSAHRMPPRLIVSFKGRKVTYLNGYIPTWMTQALEKTSYNIESLWEFFRKHRPLPDAETPISRS